MRNFSRMDTKWKNRGRELDQIAAYLLEEGVTYCLYGKRKSCEAIYEEFCSFFLIRSCFLVDYTSGMVSNMPIARERDIQKKDKQIIIAACRERPEYEQIKLNLERLGMEENKDFYFWEIFRTIYYAYARNEIRLDRVEVFLTPKCTLKCKKCISYIPYIEDRQDVPLETLKRDADLLFSKVSYVYKYKILGGESLLYPHLTEFIEYVYRAYGNQYGTLYIGTNATLLPDASDLKAFALYDVVLDVSNYSEAVPDRCKINELIKVLEQYKVRYDIKRTGEKWFDLGFPDHKIEEKKNPEDSKRQFDLCAMFCRQFHKGKLYYCCTNFAAVYAGLFPEDPNDYFDFRKDFDKKELLEYELGFSSLGYTTFCSVCQGCSEESNSHIIEMAQQAE